MVCVYLLEIPCFLTDCAEDEPPAMVSEDDIEGLSKMVRGFSYHSLMERVVEEGRRTEMETAFRSFTRPPSPKEVRDHFENKIKEKQEELNELQKQKDNCLSLSMDFWKAIILDQSLKLKARVRPSHHPRPRKPHIGMQRPQ